MKKAQIDIFEKLNAQLEGLHEEISSLSKKSPNDAVNKFKLKFINQILGEANSFLSKQYRPIDNFESFSEDDMPSNSDITLVLLQYLNCMEKLRADNIGDNGFGSWFWYAENKNTGIRTAPPRKVK